MKKIPLVQLLGRGKRPLTVGLKVNYHAFAGGDISSSNHVIKAIELQPNNYGEDVAWITNKSGCVSLDHLTRNNEV